MPHLVVIAGPNGAGKSISAPVLLKDTLCVNNFINADTIAQGLCAYEPERASIQAGKIMLNRIHNLASEKANFAFETTLASKSFSTWIPKLKTEGYQFHLIFLWLNDVALAIQRVKERVKTGGHSLPEETIIPRYQAALNNFFKLYLPLTDSLQFFNNSETDHLNLIASQSANKLNIKDEVLWKKISGEYHEK